MNISHDEFVLIKNVIKEFCDMKSKILKINKLSLKQCCLIVWSVEKNAENDNPKIVRMKNGRIMLLSKCEVCGSKKPKFIKEQEASRLLSSLGVKTTLNKIPLLGLLF